MAIKVRKTEHTGGKNGGGHWGSRAEAKSESKRRRRQEGQQIVSRETSPNSDSGLTEPVRAEIGAVLKANSLKHDDDSLL